MRREKMNNKGFSLVELIIVIAIMAILSAALAPQLMKYIEKSRVSTDQTSCASIESCVNAALAEEAVYKELAELGNANNLVFSIKFDGVDSMAADGSNITCTFPSGAAADKYDQFVAELAGSLGGLKAPKQTGMKYYIVEIETKQNSAGGAAGSTTQEIGRIDVYTKDSAQNASTSFTATP